MLTPDEKRERQRAADRKWKAANREKMAAAQSARWYANLEENRAKKRARRNLDQEREYRARPEVKQRDRERIQRWQRENPDKAKAKRERYYKRHPELQYVYTNRWRAKPRGAAIVLLSSARNRSKKQGLPFTVTLEDILPAVTAGVCQQTGIPFDTVCAGRHGPRPFSPSLDKIIPSLGYVPGNVQVVCFMYNRAKGTGTDQDVILMATALLARQPGRLTG